MSLNGTLETFALPDVLALLSATKKTGELQVDGGRGQARVWLDKGEMVGADVPRATTFVDALFEMLRLTSGNFGFDNDGRPASPAEPMALEPLVLEAQSRLGEWKSIEAVVPSLACAVKLAAEVSGAHVSVTAEQWRTLVAVAMSRDVEGVMKSLGRGEFDSCRMLKDLVQIGLVAIEDAPPPEAKPAKAEAPAPAAAEQAGSEAAGDPPARRASPAAVAAISRLNANAAAGEGSAGDEAPARVAVTARTSQSTEDGPGSDDASSGRVPIRARNSESVGGDDASRPPVNARTSGSTADDAPAGATKAATGKAAAETQAEDGAPAPAKAKAKAAPAPADDSENSEQESADLIHQLAQLQGAPASPAARPAAAGAAKTAPAPAAKTAPAKTAPAPAAATKPAAPAPAADATAGKDKDAPEDEDDEAPKGEEPLNRGLLLKFLNSVRS